MAAPHSSIGSRRRLGAELRRLRNAKGFTLDEVAERMTCSTSKISRLETGKGIPKVPDVRELMRIYGVVGGVEQDTLLQLVHDGREDDGWSEITDGVRPDRYGLNSPSRYAALENDATALRSFAISVLHGLLQTTDYARAVSAPFLPEHSAEEIDLLVAQRVKRQEALFRAEPAPLSFVGLIDEGVLHRQVGSPQVMADQLTRLGEVAELPHVAIRILPFSAGVLRVHGGDFAILDIPAELGSDIVYIESHSGTSYLDAEADVAHYDDVHIEGLRRSLSEKESRNVIEQCRERYARSPTTTNGLR
jgi:transcriptional regulator with XRE-family HTH domain